MKKPLKLLATFTFIGSAVVIAYMALTNQIQMESNMEYSKWLRSFIYTMSSKFNNPWIDLILLVILGVAIRTIVKKTQTTSS